MPPEAVVINFDSVKTYLPPLVVLFCSMLGTIMIMFRGNSEWTYPYVLYITGVIFIYTWSRASFALASDSIAAGIFWWIWMVYGFIWEVTFQSLASIVVSLGFCVLGMTSCFMSQGVETPRSSFVVYIILCLFPNETNVVRHMEPWDIFLHVVIYFFTYFFQYYTIIYLNQQLNPYHHIIRSSWVLMVSKWSIPLIGVQWMFFAYELSGKLSAKEDIESPQQPKAQPVSEPTPVYKKTKTSWSQFRHKNHLIPKTKSKQVEPRPTSRVARLMEQSKKINTI